MLKSLKYPLLLIFLISLISCDKNESVTTNSLDVKTYIELLKSGQYDSIYLPVFTYKDIPDLLEYRNETQIITKFPHNPVSSLYAPECKLGMYVLWTIESIRAGSVNDARRIMRFPSLNPILRLRNSPELNLIYDDISRTVAAKAYYDWWTDNKNKNFEDFNSIDPLENTAYEWH